MTRTTRQAPESREDRERERYLRQRDARRATYYNAHDAGRLERLESLRLAMTQATVRVYPEDTTAEELAIESWRVEL